MEKINQLIRTCSICGIKKPLSAFLQISGTKGTNYGNICSSCRGTNASASTTTKKETEERSTTSTSVRLGAKEKIALDKEKQRIFLERKELEKKELKKRFHLEEEKTERAGVKEKAEKDHRGDIEARQKQNFLINIAKKTFPIATPEINKGFLDEHSKILETAEQEIISRQENIKSRTDLSVAVFDPTSATIERQSEIFLRFIEALALEDAPIMRTLMLQLYGKKQAGVMQERMVQQSNVATQQTHIFTQKEKIETTKANEKLKATTKSFMDKQPAKKTPAVTDENPMSDYIKKNWGPSRRR